MSEFKIKPQSVRSTAQDLNCIAKQMRNLEEQMKGIQYGLSFEIAQKERIRNRLKTARNHTKEQYKEIYNSTSALNNIVNTYETTERRLAGAKTPVWDMVKDTVLNNIRDAISLGSDGNNPGMGLGPALIGPGGLIGKLIDGTSSVYTYEKSEQKDKFGIGSKKFDAFDLDQNKPSLFPENREEIKGSKITPFKIVDRTWKDTKSALHTEDIVGTKDGTHGSYKFDFLKRETSAELYGGLYYTDPSTGERKLRAAGGASVGFTMSALSLEEELQLGNSNLGGYVKGEAVAGKVEAKAGIAAGLRDADGKFNPTVHGKVSVEAIAVEASVKGGVKIAGTDVGVKASVNVGVGAHAEFGFKDGKLSADIGASLGIGGSVKLEVDISGTVNAVKGAATSVWNTVSGWFQ